MLFECDRVSLSERLGSRAMRASKTQMAKRLQYWCDFQIDEQTIQAIMEDEVDSGFGFCLPHWILSFCWIDTIDIVRHRQLGRLNGILLFPGASIESLDPDWWHDSSNEDKAREVVDGFDGEKYRPDQNWPPPRTSSDLQVLCDYWEGRGLDRRSLVDLNWTMEHWTESDAIDSLLAGIERACWSWRG